MTRTFKFKYHYYQECKKCGYRLPLSVSQFDNNAHILISRDENCLTCQINDFDVIQVVQKEEELPRM